MKVIFWGTTFNAAQILTQIHQAGLDLSLVVTTPDKPAGRGQQLKASAVKKTALKLGLEVFQPEQLNSTNLAYLAQKKTDFWVIVAYGKILPELALKMPKRAALNVHYSLLPKWRGAAPVQFALLNGERKTGVSIIKINAKLDAGDVLAQVETEITPTDNTASLTQKLTELACPVLLNCLQHFDDYPPKPQIAEQVSWTHKLHTKDRQIDWQQTAEQIFCQYQAFAPKPGVYTFFNGQRLKLDDIEISKDTSNNNQTAGSVVHIAKNGLSVKCKTGTIIVRACQLENHKVLSAYDFVNGYKIKLQTPLF